MQFRLFGTPVVVGFDALILIALFAWWGYNPSLGTASFMVAAAFAVFAFLSLLTHEFMHVFTARRFGIPCHQIRVMFLGMGAHIEARRSAKETFFISFAGPATSFTLFVGLSLLLRQDIFTEMPFVVVYVVALLIQFNFIIALFNILPLFPLDGGRVFHSIVWGVTRDRHKGLVAAVYLSRTFIILGMAYLFISGTPLFGLIWPGLIAYFLWQAGTAELYSS